MEHQTLSFDGFGVNGRDEFRTRLLTFAPGVSEETRAALGPVLAAAPQLLDVVKEFSEQIDDNPDEGPYRACCYAEVNYGTPNPHKPDCSAVAALKAAGVIK